MLCSDNSRSIAQLATVTSYYVGSRNRTRDWYGRTCHGWLRELKRARLAPVAVRPSARHVGDLLQEQSVKIEIPGLDCFRWRRGSALPDGTDGQESSGGGRPVDEAVECKDWEINLRT